MAVRRAVAFLLGRADRYGGDRVIASYASYLQTRGVDVTLYSIASPGDVSFYGGMPILSPGMRGFPVSRWSYVSAAMHMLRIVERADVLVATWTPTLIPARFCRRIGRARRLVWLAQDYPEMFASSPFEAALLDRGVNIADVSVAISKAISKVIQRKSPGNVRLIPNGIGLEFRVSAVPPAQRSSVLYVGDVMPRKGLAEFLAAANALRSRGLQREIVVVSKTPLNDVGGISGVRVACNLTDRELAEEYRRAAVFVCTSHHEGLGLPALEAMACGAPVVTTENGGAADYAEDGVNCLTVSAGESRPVVEAVERILADASLANALVENGLATVKQFSWERSWREFEGVCFGE